MSIATANAKGHERLTSMPNLSQIAQIIAAQLLVWLAGPAAAADTLTDIDCELFAKTLSYMGSAAIETHTLPYHPSSQSYRLVSSEAAHQIELSRAARVGSLDTESCDWGHRRLDGVFLNPAAEYVVSFTNPGFSRDGRWAALDIRIESRPDMHDDDMPRYRDIVIAPVLRFVFKRSGPDWRLVSRTALAGEVGR